MANLKQWILDQADGEEIEAVCIGDMGWGHGYGKEGVPHFDEMPKFQLLTWEEAAKWLDYEFDVGYGAPSCNAVFAWTESKVIFISQYDGLTAPESIPRNPTTVKPYMPGG